ncbi:MAG TPA: hypothetical protein VHY31_28340 [Streptosporangiaceae bacterium]|nr:hypothetical protein [Streptosporangiaceae bacterium]
MIGSGPKTTRPPRSISQASTGGLAARLPAGRRIQVGAEDYGRADAVLREALLASAGPRPVEQLLGVRPAALGELAGRGIPVRVYVLFGDDWFRYWMRRTPLARANAWHACLARHRRRCSSCSTTRR